MVLPEYGRLCLLSYNNTRTHNIRRGKKYVLVFKVEVIGIMLITVVVVVIKYKQQ